MFRKKAPVRILIIDDEAALTRMVKMTMEKLGDYVVETLNESPQASEVAREFKPDIILLDVVMPEADGGDVAAMLQGSPTTDRIPIIFVSAMVSRSESNRGLYQSGGENFLAKPVDAKILSQAITQVLGK